MQNSILLKVVSERSLFRVIKSTIKKYLKELSFSKEDLKNIIKATKELFENAIIHAYKNQSGIIEVEITTFSCGVRVDIRDYGLPMSPKKYLSVNIDYKEIKGFNRVFHLTDKFEYKNLGKDGKVFSIYKYTSNSFFSQMCLMDEKQPSQKIIPFEKPLIDELTIRDFEISDEEGISKIIYQNYGHSYIRDLFYYPQKILDNENKKFYSIVAEVKSEIVGHFTLIKLDDSNIAEIGVAVVSPKCKGQVIMNRMFIRLIQKAKEIGLDAIFGEAVMYHIFSQKANLKYNFSESCFELGKTIKNTSIENNPLSQIAKRGSVLIFYKMLKKQHKKIYLPSIYRDIIVEIYQRNSDITFEVITEKKEVSLHSKIYYSFDPLFNIATIIIEKYGKDFNKKFHTLFYHLRIKHCDMIYADINLETTPNIEYIVESLNKDGFFFSGVVFLKHKNQDYLHLQYKNSKDIGSKNFVCYSDFCKSLIEYINGDKKRVIKE